jgi:hypothetical protein
MLELEARALSDEEIEALHSTPSSSAPLK